MVNYLLDWLARLSIGQASAWILLQNVLVFFLSLLAGHVLLNRYGDRPVAPAPDPLEWQEVVLAAGCVLLNALVTLVGWILWRQGIIVVRRDTGWLALWDALALLLMMDLAMYLFHRAAHCRWLYSWLHSTHHRYDRPRPLSLFVLNPLEVLGFGSLWLVVITLYHASWLGIILYLSLNLMFGTLGHLGVEPFPRSWRRQWLLSHLGSSTFHANHHQDRQVNFGFYTDIWDRIFGTRDCSEP